MIRNCESYFRLNGCVKKQNYHIWNASNRKGTLDVALKLENCTDRRNGNILIT